MFDGNFQCQFWQLKKKYGSKFSRAYDKHGFDGLHSNLWAVACDNVLEDSSFIQYVRP